MNRSASRLAAVFLAMSASAAIGADLPPDVIVRQGTATLTYADIDAFAARMPAEQRAGYFDNAKRLDSTLRQMLTERQIADEARAIGLDKDPAVERQIKLAVDGALTTVRLAKLRESVVIPDMAELARERYLTDKSKFNDPAVLDVKHILISSERHTDQEARELAEKVRADAVADANAFEALVSKYSEDGSAAANGGLMRQAGDNKQYVPEFAAAANKLTKVGEVSPVTKTKFGYHVLMLIKRAPARVRSFDEVKEQLISELQTDYRQQELVKYLQNVKGNELDSNPELVNSLRSRYGSVTAEMPEYHTDAAEAEPAGAPSQQP
ncbi:MAG: peptidylprolyl isomerase [Dokdonella sp.]